MINIESIYPYTIVEENGLYGIADKDGNLVVPCIMDDITNSKDEETGLDCWEDFFCVPVIKEGKYGFFTSNGKFIEPAYENFALDPCGGEIHVKTEDGFAVFVAPGYILEEIPIAYSLLSDYYLENFEVDMKEDLEDFNLDMGKRQSSQTWGELGIGQDILSAIKGRLHEFGYGYTEDLWNSTSDSTGKVDMEDFVHDSLSRLSDFDFIEEKLKDIKAAGTDVEAVFWEVLEDKDGNDLLPWCVNMAMRGAASFISRKGIAQANIPLLNKRISGLLNGQRNDGYLSLFRLVDRLLPCPEHGTGEIIPIHFPVGKRPACVYSFCGNDIDGEIGEIYLYEHSMHMYSVSVNVYAAYDSTELLDENHILSVSDVALSDLLMCLKLAMDPNGENTELSEAIARATKLEYGKSEITEILRECGIFMLSLSDYGRTPRFYDGYVAEDVDFVYVSNYELMLVLDARTPHVNSMPLEDNCGNYSWIVEDIKAAANTAFKKCKA